MSWNDESLDWLEEPGDGQDMGMGQGYYIHTLQDFMEYVSKDPSGVAQDLVEKFKRTDCAQLSELLDHFLHLPAVEKR